MTESKKGGKAPRRIKKERPAKRQKAAALAAPSPSATEVDPRRNIDVPDDHRTHHQVVAELSSSGIVGNASILGAMSRFTFEDYSLTENTFALQRLIKASKAGDTGLADTLLVAQASVLNSIFLECTRRAANNMGEYPEAMETYMRLGLKAQSQCRATMESLSKIKNPPNATFVKQANIAHNQQVNNGQAEPARTETIRNTPIELLEEGHGEGVDASATGAPGRGDPHMETVGEVHGAQDG
ncbi:MAG: hypothetical protein ACLGHW_06475 [Gammaproteobacteria bacterium]